MPHLQYFIEVLAVALCECSEAALAKLVPFESSSLEVARSVHRRLLGLSPNEVRGMIRELVSAPTETVELAVQDGVLSAKPTVPEEFRDTLIQYLDLLPEVARQALRRPGDPEGFSVPSNFSIRRAEDWLLFLPDRTANFHPGDLPEQLDNWRVEQLRGLGPTSEVWDGYDDEQPELSPACLKFVTDPKLRISLPQYENLFRTILDLDVIHGLIPLRSVYLSSPVPCLEYVHVAGYDLANVMHDSRWRNERSRPEQAAQIARRIAKIVGKLHRKNPPIVHRGLKPSNILLAPTAEGRVALWVSDIGWGEITAPLSTAQVDVSHAVRRGLRGSHCLLYASPQLRAGAPADPRDDVYAIGMIWYQLLMRDPMAQRPTGNAWTTELRRQGLMESHINLLMSCLSDVPAERPGDGHALADLITASLSPIRNGDSGTFTVKGGTAADLKRPKHKSAPPSLRIKKKRSRKPREQKE
jgi:hypothetical protein